MTVSAARVTVTSAATLLATDTDVGACSVANRGTVTVYLGGPDVTSSTGYQLDAGASLQMDLHQVDSLYGITASSTSVCHVIQSGA